MVCSAIFLLTVLPAVAQQLPSTPLNQGLIIGGQAAGYPIGEGGAPKVPFGTAWVRYINGMVLLMGAFLMIRVIYGGWLWLSARGNEQQVEKAKSMILHSVIAIGIIIGGRMIAELVITVASQVSLGDVAS